jgi:uncharacterized protein YbbC (DUF1343 family)
VNADALAESLNDHWNDPGAHYALASTTQPSNIAISHPPAGLRFRPIRYKPFFQMFKDEPIQGVQVHLEPDTAANLVEINFKLLQALDAKSVFARTDAKRFSSFDKVCGSPETREVLMNGGDLDALFAKWRAECETFRKNRVKFMLY